MERARDCVALEEEIATHLPMHGQPQIIVEPEQQIFAAAINLSDAMSGERVGEVVRGGVRQHPRPIHRTDASDLTAYEVWSKAARRRLYFGKLWHFGQKCVPRPPT
jgi:hypothetical protein